MVVSDPDATLLTVCANGYGKRTPFGPNLETEFDEELPDHGEHDEELEAEVEPAEPERQEGEGNEGGEEDERREGDEGGEGSEEGEDLSSQRSYRTQRRGGKGLHDIKTTERNGPVIGVVRVSDEDELLMMTARGKIQRIHASDISIIGRNTQGVRIMSLDEDDTLVAVKRVPMEEENGKGEEA
jgi:DNA gyrase subunit A